MDYRTLYKKTVAELRQLAKNVGAKLPAGASKALIVELILEKEAQNEAQKNTPAPSAKAVVQPSEAATEPAKTADTVAVAEPATPVAEAAAEPAAPAKKRGRPRKDASAAPVPEADTFPAKKRGRPRKDAAVQAEAAVQEMSEASAPEAKEAAPAKRGRPRKDAAEQAIPAAQAAPAEQAQEASPSPAPEAREVHDAPQAQGSTPATTAPITAPQPEATKDAEPTDKPSDAQSEQPAHGFYHRSLSTQQRMGARTHPLQNQTFRQQANPNAANNAPRRFGAPSGAQPYNRPAPTADYNRARPQNAPAPLRTPPTQAADGTQNRRFNPPDTQNRRFAQPTGDYQRPDAARKPFNRADASVEIADANTQAPSTQPRFYRQPSAEPSQPSTSTVADADAQRSFMPTGEAVNPAVPEMLSSSECADGSGVLEIHPDGYGFLRAENYLPGNRDVYVSAAQIRRFNLRTGDFVLGKTRPQQFGDRSVGLIYINEVNGETPDKARSRRPFDTLIPVYPDKRLHMERSDQNDLALRLIDLIAPIGKGQRGMIVSPPKAGKTTLLKKIANAITTNNPDVHLIMLLVDERPEEVTDMQRSVQGEVVYSTFDEAPENHTRVSEMVLERAQRLVELGKDVVILLDSITRLARAYNLVIPPTGRSLSGGLDPGALIRPKRFFGAARNIENGGSLTIIATALVDTGSRMDDIIFEEFKGTGNMELHLDRSLSDRRLFPAFDVFRSGTRREELLLSRDEMEANLSIRRKLANTPPQDALQDLLEFIVNTKTNQEFLQRLKGWISICEKDGFKKRQGI